MAHGAELLGLARAFAAALAGVLEKQVAPDELADRGRGERRGAVVAGGRGDAADLVAAALREETGGAQFRGIAIPDDDPLRRNARLLQPRHDGLDDPAMRCKVTPACRANLDAHTIRGRDQRAPGRPNVRLLGDAEHQRIHHPARDRRVFLELQQGERILRGKDDRSGGRRHRSRRLHRAERPEEKERRESGRKAKHEGDYWRRAGACQRSAREAAAESSLDFSPKSAGVWTEVQATFTRRQRGTF